MTTPHPHTAAAAQPLYDGDERRHVICLCPECVKARTAQPERVPPEMSPDFTDTARAALLWVLWHHQGGSSPVGQPIRFALGMGQYDSLNEHQLREAKRWGRLHQTNPAAWPLDHQSLTDAQLVVAIEAAGFKTWDSRMWELKRQIEAAHGIKPAKEQP